MSNYGTWPPTMGHRVVVVETVAGAVSVTVGRVTGYACGEDATGEFRSVSLRLADGRVSTREGVDEVFDLDGMYLYGTSEAAVSAVREAVAELAAALLPPKAAVPVEALSTPGHETSKSAAMVDEAPF